MWGFGKNWNKRKIEQDIERIRGYLVNIAFCSFEVTVFPSPIGEDPGVCTRIFFNCGPLSAQIDLDTIRHHPKDFYSHILQNLSYRDYITNHPLKLVREIGDELTEIMETARLKLSVQIPYGAIEDMHMAYVSDKKQTDERNMHHHIQRCLDLYMKHKGIKSTTIAADMLCTHVQQIAVNDVLES